MTDEMKQLISDWCVAKNVEDSAKDERREIEDKIKALAGIKEEVEGTSTIKMPDGSQMKVESRINRTVDADKVQELAAEHGLMDHLSSLFRWKPELNMTAWKQADDAITGPLAGAITAKPGRPSFKFVPTKEQ